MRKALYAGSFDPITNGHLDLISRATKLADHLIVGVIDNPSKSPLFTIEERVKMIRELVSDHKNIEVVCFSGLLAKYVKENEVTVVIRGLRASMDFEYEIQMAQMNASLYNEMETIFLMTNPSNSFLSSSLVKEVFKLDGSIEGFVPDVVLKYMKQKYNK
jgi:pantetheine-phosphate adenylyltransferase